MNRLLLLVTPLNIWTRLIFHGWTRPNSITNISHSPKKNKIYLIHYILNLHKNFILDERTVRLEAHSEKSPNI